MNHAQLISMDDIVGRLVAIKRGRVSRQVVAYATGVKRIKQVETALNGLPLKVEAMSLPFLAVRVMHNGMKMVVDTREVELMSITDDYAAALAGLQQVEPTTIDASEPDEDLPACHVMT
jgi:hypothetical protein